MHLLQTTALFLSLTLGGCANLPSGDSAAAVGIDGVACAGTVASQRPGLDEASNTPLLTKVQLPSGKGGVCAGKVFSVTAPVVLYRVFDASNPHSKLGGWWALTRPTGSRDDYRAANAICKEWSPLDKLVSCEVRPGSQVVLGTTQSAVCADGSTYPKTAAQQVYVANDGRAGIIHVGACSEESVWP
ncbi:MAG: hypothetical protein FD135_2846 [Comamonadaceae bacterium]|nr:MAG: hypothetical protein FD135_2846 [Comamonadaceae bacterium]